MKPLVVFDIDGTLLHRTSENDLGLQRVYWNALGVNVRREWGDYRSSTDSGITHEVCRLKLGRRATPAEIIRVKRSLMTLLRELRRRTGRLYEPTPGAETILECLRAGGCEVAIATGNWRISAGFKLAAARIRRAGVTMATADDHEVRAGIIGHAIARCGGRREYAGIAYIGDRPWDAHAARALRIGFVGVGCGRQAVNLRGAGARACVADFRNLDAFAAAVVRECTRARSRASS
ncbi:MAG: HAD family hydrolase [Candidatus Coatesbacteria bacterium]